MSDELATSAKLTANDRFKQRSASWSAFGLIAAVGLHFSVIAFARPFEAADLGVVVDEMEAVTLPPEVKIPPPPEQIARPATPKVASVDVAEDVTIAPTTFETNPVENLPPPPSGGGSPADRPSFIPYDTPPKLVNTEEIRTILKRYYPKDLKEAGVGGRVELWIYVDAIGKVHKSEVKTSSGHVLMDEAAEMVASEMVFKPALNRDKKTDVWVSQWITFRVR
jgi:TonB family protein